MMGDFEFRPAGHAIEHEVDRSLDQAEEAARIFRTW